MGDISNEHGERFHQDITTMESRYQGCFNEAMMGEYFWFLMSEDRKSNSLQHFVIDCETGNMIVSLFVNKNWKYC